MELTHTPQVGDHYRDLYDDALHRDLVVTDFDGGQVRLVCHDIDHALRPSVIARPVERLRPSRTGRSGMVYMGPWAPGRQLAATPADVVKSPLGDQPMPEVGQIWEDLNERARLHMLEVMELEGDRVRYRRWSPTSPREHHASAHTTSFGTNKWGSRGYVHRAASMREYRELVLNADALAEIL